MKIAPARTNLYAIIDADIAAGRTAMAATEENTQRVLRGKAPLQLLYVENDAWDVQLFKSSLDSYFEKFSPNETAEVETARSAIAAQEILKVKKFDAIFVDMKLEGSSGLEVVQYCRNQKIETPIFIVSGSTAEKPAETDAACRLGKCWLTFKTIQPEHFKAILEKL